MEEKKELHRAILDDYRKLVATRHPDQLEVWPVLSGYDAKYAGYKDWTIIAFIATGNPVVMTTSGIGELPPAAMGAATIDATSKQAIRERLERHLRLGPSDALMFMDPQGRIEGKEFELMLQKHEYAMGIGPMKVFLSHKGADKPLVREFKQTLELLGFDPWLDEDAMPAGTNLERGILQGFKESCAAIFFITPNYVDENYLATEVNYAVREKRAKGEKFQIITLVFDDGGKVHVPDLLHDYVWKTPKTQLEALREILKALPIKVGAVYWKNP